MRLFALLGGYLMGWFKLSHDSEMKYVSVPRLMMAILVFSFTVYSQTNTINSIVWSGHKRMNEKFMSHFIETKIGSDLDSLKIYRDITALTRLNGISLMIFILSNLEPTLVSIK